MLGDISPWMSGGASVHPSELMRALRVRYDFRGVTPVIYPSSELPRDPKIRAVRAIPYLTRYLQLAVAARFLGEVELLHIHDARLFAIKNVLSRPLVTTFHGYLTLEAAADYHTRPGLPRYEIYDWILDACVRESDALIAVDSRIAHWLAREYHARNVSVIPNGVDLVRFRPRLPSPRILRQLGIPDSVPKLLAAKHFTPKNGMETVVRAMPLVLKEVPDAHLVLAGSGRLKSHLAALISDLGISDHVTMPGQVANELMPDVIAACDVGVIPSMPVAGVEEATSILMLELMASAKLVVASSIGGLRETIQPQVTGILVEPNSPPALAQALVTSLSDSELRSQIGGAARQYVEKHHSWSAVGGRVAAIYDRLLA